MLTEAQTAAFRRHLDTCPQCRTWAENQVQITRQLISEASPPATLSPAAVARIQQNVFSRMRRALIMNNVRTVAGATAAVAVLALIVVFFVWQNRTLNTVGIVEQVVPQLPAVEQVIPEVDMAAQATAEPAAVETITDEQLFEAVSAADAAAVERLL